MDVESVSSFEQAVRYQQDASAADRALAVRFYTDEVEDPAESLKAGRPMFKTVEFCEIRAPGDKSNVRHIRLDKCRPENDPRIRFQAAYARFKSSDRAEVHGTLLREWGMMPRATAKSYEYEGIVTVEQLAAVSETVAAKIPGCLAERQKAIDFMAVASKQAPLNEARAENQKLRAELDALREQVQAMATAQGVTLKADGTPRKKPGPKPKSETAE